MTTAAELNPRGRPSDEGRFIWLSSLAAERIVNELGATQAAFGIAVYLALARLSSQQKNAATIQATVTKIAGMARLSYRKTFETLHALAEQAKVIAITPGERQPGQPKQAASTYTLLALRLHNRKSPDCTRDTQQTAENPKESFFQKDSTKHAALGGRPKAPPPARAAVKNNRSCKGGW